jgi:uncharacterized BrkB/YihY/UPF0761 family membrane protein
LTSFPLPVFVQPRFDPPIYHAIDYGVKKIFDHDSAGIIVFAALLTVWYVSRGVRAIMGAINRIYEVDDRRPLLIRWPVSLGLAVSVVSGVVGAMLLVEAVPTPKGAGPMSPKRPAGSAPSPRSSP